MEKEFIPYQQALDLKELGFDEPCLATHGFLDLYIGSQDGHLKAPTYSQAFRFFREEYCLYAWVKIEYEYGGVTPTYYITGKRQGDIPGGPFKTYEEAELACLNKLIEIVKNKRDNI
jgi:hypothetical protein